LTSPTGFLADLSFNLTSLDGSGFTSFLPFVLTGDLDFVVVLSSFLAGFADTGLADAGLTGVGLAAVLVSSIL
jgi:hypothetical protein